MRDWVKILLAVGGGAAIALTIALPIVLTGGDDDVEVPEDPGAQRFPETNFVKFDDLWTGKLSRKSFGYGFSKVNPDNYICTSDGHYYSRPIDKYNIDTNTAKYSDCTDGSEKLTKDGYSTWRKSLDPVSCSLSADEKRVFCYNNYMKQWRHSFYADYYVYDIEAEKEVTALSNLKQAQYCGWSPAGHNLVCVDNDKNIHVSNAAGDAWVEVTNDGGWCDKETRILGVEYGGKDETKCIYNGVPDWNYEEEMISTTNTIFWSPDGTKFAFVSFDVSGIEKLEYSVYPEHLKAGSPNEIDQNSFEQYPRLNLIRYAKAGGTIAKTKLYVYDLETKAKKEINEIKQDGTADLTFDMGVGTSQENRWFTRFAWSPNSEWFVSVWTSRAATQSKALACKADGSGCKPAGREDGGVTVSYFILYFDIFTISGYLE